MGLLRALPLVALLALSSLSRTGHADEPADPASALYQQGAAAAAEGRWTDAVTSFEQAVAIRATPVGLFNLAQAERNLGRLASAKRHFVSARALAEREGADDVRRLADDGLAAVSPRVPRVVLELPRDAARVEAQVDGRPAEIVDAEIEVDPGAHRLVVTAAGEKPVTRDVVLGEAERRTLRIRFERKPPALALTPRPPAPKPETPPPSRASATGPPAGAWVLGGIGVAALAAGTVFHVRRNDALGEAARDCVSTGDGWRCPASLENDPNHRSLIDTAHRDETIRNVLLGVGAGALAAGGVWWALSTGPEKRDPGVAVALTPLPGAPSARVRVSF